jgi:plasmid stabilization system protein ParE
MIVVYRPEAVSDLRRIARWYRKHRPEGEARFFERFRAAMRRIEQFPEAPPRTSIDGAVVHKARVLRTAYSIAFTSQGGTVSILAVIHGSRSPAYWRRRMRLRP